MIILAPSILGADFKRLGEQVQEVDRAGVPYIHLDIMDGTFVPSISFEMCIRDSRTASRRDGNPVRRGSGIYEECPGSGGPHLCGCGSRLYFTASAAPDSVWRKKR